MRRSVKASCRPELHSVVGHSQCVFCECVCVSVHAPPCAYVRAARAPVLQNQNEGISASSSAFCSLFNHLRETTVHRRAPPSPPRPQRFNGLSALHKTHVQPFWSHASPGLTHMHMVETHLAAILTPRLSSCFSVPLRTEHDPL